MWLDASIEVSIRVVEIGHLSFFYFLSHENILEYRFPINGGGFSKRHSILTGDRRNWLPYSKRRQLKPWIGNSQSSLLGCSLAPSSSSAASSLVSSSAKSCCCCCCEMPGKGGCCGCCCRKKPRGISRKGTVKTKDVQALGQAYKEKVQPDLEELSMNMEDNEGASSKETAPILGRLHYTVDYDFKKTELTVGVVECAEVRAMDAGGTSDPFVRVYLHPDDKRKFETKVQEKTLCPVFNETFVFKIPYSEMTSKTLVLMLLDFDRFSAADHIGQLKLPLGALDLGNAIDRWAELQIPDSEADKDAILGDVCFSLRYVPTAGKLTVVAIEAKNLRKMDVTGLSDPYIKMSLFIGEKRVKKKKTSVKRKTLNPYYNESFTFDVKFEEIEKVTVVVSVVDHDLVGPSDPIGQVSVGCKATGNALKHWSEMLANPRRPIAQWHTLKPIPEAKK